MALILPPDCLRYGLKFVKIAEWQQELMSDAAKMKKFRAHYGSTPLSIAEMWYDLQQGYFPDATLTDQENSIDGFKRYMMCHFYLWTGPKNASVTSSLFDCCEQYALGRKLWGMIGKMAALLPRKIHWDDTLADPTGSDFVGSIDCTDFKIWEPRHHIDLPFDSSFYSQKIKHAAWKYEIVMDITQAKCMSVVGPFPAATSDIEVFRSQTKNVMLAMPPGKMLIADGVYLAGRLHQDEVGMFSNPNPGLDHPDLHRVKSRLRARHETFNGRIKNYDILKKGFESVNRDHHEAATKAVCTITQYEMDNGSPVFDP